MSGQDCSVCFGVVRIANELQGEDTVITITKNIDSTELRAGTIHAIEGEWAFLLGRRGQRTCQHAFLLGTVQDQRRRPGARPSDLSHALEAVTRAVGKLLQQWLRCGQEGFLDLCHWILCAKIQALLAG